MMIFWKFLALTAAIWMSGVVVTKGVRGHGITMWTFLLFAASVSAFICLQWLM